MPRNQCMQWQPRYPSGWGRSRGSRLIFAATSGPPALSLVEARRQHRRLFRPFSQLFPHSIEHYENALGLSIPRSLVAGDRYWTAGILPASCPPFPSVAGASDVRAGTPIGARISNGRRHWLSPVARCPPKAPPTRTLPATPPVSFPRALGPRSESRGRGGREAPSADASGLTVAGNLPPPATPGFEICRRDISTWNPGGVAGRVRVGGLRRRAQTYQ